MDLPEELMQAGHGVEVDPEKIEAYMETEKFREQITQAHIAGQCDAGIDPSFSNALLYANKVIDGVAEIVDLPVCPGCGNKGWTAACHQCIPY